MLAHFLGPYGEAKPMNGSGTDVWFRFAGSLETRFVLEA